jgi:hypothetical protein
VSADEQASIVNYFPQLGNTTVTGTVLDANGVPVPGAAVGAVVGGKTVVATATAQGAGSPDPGRFEVTGIAPGSLTLIAIDPATSIPGRVDVAVSDDTTFDAGIVALLPESALGTVEIHLSLGSTSTAGTTVNLTTSEFRPFWSLSGTLDDDGEYTFIHVPSGEIRVSTVLGVLVGQLNPGGILQLTIREGSGCATASGQVVGPDYEGIPGIRVGAWGSAGTMLAETVTDVSGHYSLVGLGGSEAQDVYIQGFDPATGRVTGTESLSLNPCSESTPELDISPLYLIAEEQLGRIAVTGIHEATGAPLANVRVRLHQERDLWQPTLVLDSNGRGTFTGSPYTNVAISADVAAPNWGWATTYVAPETTTSVVLRVGAGVDTGFPVDLTGSDGIPHFVGQYGWVHDTSDGGCYTFCSGMLSLGGSWRYPWLSRGRLSQEGREVGVAPLTESGVETTTRAFVPPDGRFVRSLQIIRNVSSELVATTPELIDETSGDWTVVSTSSGDPEVAAEDDHASFTTSDESAPEVALVFKNPEAPTPSEISDWAVSEGYGQLTTTWPALTLAPGQTVILMRYVVKRPHGETADLEAQVQSLVDLTDPEALAGMTAEERAAVINFNIPAELLQP